MLVVHVDMALTYQSPRPLGDGRPQGSSLFSIFVSIE